MIYHPIILEAIPDNVKTDKWAFLCGILEVMFRLVKAFGKQHVKCHTNYLSWLMSALTPLISS